MRPIAEHRRRSALSTIRRPLVAVLALACLVLAAAGCGDEGDGDDAAGSAASAPAAKSVPFEGSIEDGLPNGYDQPSEKPLTIGLLNPLRAVETLSTLGRAAKAETERLGGKLIELDAQGSPDKQVSQFEQLVNQGVDGIGVYPLDGRALAPVLAKAQKAGIPVIAIDLTLESPKPVPGLASQLWIRRDQAAYQVAQAAAQALAPGSKVGLIGWKIPAPTLEYAVERSGYWAERFGLQVVGRTNDPSGDIAGGEKAMTAMLGKHPDVKGVLAYAEEAAIGAASAARAAGSRGIQMFGVNGGTVGLDAVRDGRLAGTVQIAIPSTAKQMVWGLYNAAAGRKIPPTVLADEPAAVTKETLTRIKPWTEQLKAEYGS